jgi:mRNA-degrading endonuclease RelE of RelBE toxin-antitoxin system
MEPLAHCGGFVMDIEQSVLEKLKKLPSEKQQQVLDFIESIQSRSIARRPRRSLKGMWADLRVQIGEDDITQVRREMWGNFPREGV